MSKLNQRGFSVVAVVLLVAIIALVGVIGWRVFSAQKELSKSNNTESSQQVTQSSDPATGGEIKSTADFSKVQGTLDSSVVDTDLDTTALDQDLNDIL